MPALEETPALAEKLNSLPASPGVYQHKDAAGTVLYVGKAKNLRSRVRSYFQEGRPGDGKFQALVRKIADIEVIVTDTEAEALILENNLIKKLKPRYNISLRDDKSYPYVCITSERFPRVFPTRRIRRDGSRYFGPYTDVKSLRLVLRTIRSLFKLRSCTLNLSHENIAAGKFQPCLDYHIKKCGAPCVGYETQEHYDQTIRQIEKLLNGHTRELIGLLRDEMKQCAATTRFEEAAELRDRIQALEQYSEKQKVVSLEHVDRDLFGIAADYEHDIACGVIFKVREGKIIGRQHKYMRRIEGVSDADLMQALLEDYYTETTFFPEEVILASAASTPGLIAEVLRRERGRKVAIKVPERGEKVDLMRMVASNAQLLLEELRQQRQKQEEERIPRSVMSLQRDLRLSHPPRRIECFDISHLSGTGTVASCVVFEDGQPRKSEYRTYKIHSAEGKPDDFQSMREVVTRRYSRVIDQKGPLPDLILIDGGKGQLSSAVTAMKEAGIYGKAPVIGLAKRLEEVFFPGDTEPRMIPRTSSALRLLQRVRDEAHRFAVTFQRKQRRLSTLRSELRDIPGVGPKSVQKLLSHFGSVKRVGNASIEEMAAIVGPAVARKVSAYFDETRTSA